MPEWTPIETTGTDCPFMFDVCLLPSEADALANQIIMIIDAAAAAHEYAESAWIQCGPAPAVPEP